MSNDNNNSDFSAFKIQLEEYGITNPNIIQENFEKYLKGEFDINELLEVYNNDMFVDINNIFDNSSVPPRTQNIDPYLMFGATQNVNSGSMFNNINNLFNRMSRINPEPVTNLPTRSYFDYLFSNRFFGNSNNNNQNLSNQNSDEMNCSSEENNQSFEDDNQHSNTIHFNTCDPVSPEFHTSPTESGNLFGGPVASGNLFGGPVASGNLFGGPVASGNLFGGPVASGNLFGGPNIIRFTSSVSGTNLNENNINMGDFFNMFSSTMSQIENNDFSGVSAFSNFGGLFDLNNLMNYDNLEQIPKVLNKKDIKKFDDNKISYKQLLDENLKIPLDDDTTCTICMDDIKPETEGEHDDQIYILLPCNHIFHHECIMEWFKKYNFICPNCKKECGKYEMNL